MFQYNIQYACTSHIGLLRSNHEDNFWCDHIYLPEKNSGLEIVFSETITDQKNRPFAVFDGMGGEEAGEAAAHVAAMIMENHAGRLRTVEAEKAKETIRSLFFGMNEAVVSYCRRNKLYSMGSTASVLLFASHSVIWGNIGDSRIYRFRDHKLEQLSQDHIITNPFTGRRDLTQCLGIDPAEMEIEPYFAEDAVSPGDRYLLCSDGLTDMVDEPIIEETMDSFESGRCQACVEVLKKHALEHGGRDNITIILCEVA